MTLTKEQITAIAKSIGLPFAVFRAFIEVESGGTGFHPDTGKIIIQFEPHIFARYLTQFKVDHKIISSLVDGKKKYTVTVGDLKFTNGVEGQTSEWNAFNVAFKMNKRAALLSTSLGLSQVMGFHYARLGYPTVDAMWDGFKSSEYEQILGMAKFIQTDIRLLNALKKLDWAKAAELYNGAGYKVNKYDVKLANAYKKYNT